MEALAHVQESEPASLEEIEAELANFSESDLSNELEAAVLGGALVSMSHIALFPTPPRKFMKASRRASWREPAAKLADGWRHGVTDGSE